jgi:hypothetical protein
MPKAVKCGSWEDETVKESGIYLEMGTWVQMRHVGRALFRRGRSKAVLLMRIMNAVVEEKKP